MTALARETSKYALGIALITGLVIGGGAAAGLVTDTIVQLVVVVAAAIEFSRPRRSPIPVAIGLTSGALVGAMVLQLVPLPTGLIDALRPSIVGSDVTGAIGNPELATISLGVGRTLEATLFVTAALLFFLAVLRFRPDQVIALLPYFFLGVACNALAAAVQYSAAGNVSIDTLLPYSITAGFFANVNHFSSLLFISIPLVAYYGVVSGKFKLALFELIAILVLLLAAGSRAGVLIGLVITILSLVFLGSRAKGSILAVAAVFMGLSVFGLGAWTKFDASSLDPEFGRGEFARTTFEGIKDNWLLGVGYGNFPDAYKIYERPVMVFREYVNHAHNDFLEVVFEGGLLAAVLIALYLVMLGRSFWMHRNDSLRRMALLSVAFLLVHSLVDYPLRTMSLALSFAFLNAIIFHAGSFAPSAWSEPAMEMEHDGDGVVVTMAPTVRE